jgi:hypothetical protein
MSNSEAYVSPHWDQYKSIADKKKQARIESGEILIPDNEALRAYAEKLKEPVHVIGRSKITEEEVGQVMYRRAQQLMFIKSKEVLPFVVDDHNRAILRAIKLYVMNDERFEHELHGQDEAAGPFKLSKGIMLRGLQGCGKTLILKMLANTNSLAKHNGVVHSISDIKQRGWGDQVNFGLYSMSDIYSCVGIEHEYKQKDTGENYLKSLRNIKRPLVFDDLGFEKAEAINYGNRTNVMEVILQRRYDLFVEEGIKTFLSTNLVDGNEIEKVYGPRIRSRIREMCNVFTFNPADDAHMDRRK